MAPDPHPHASLTIETVLQVCFRLLVALTLAAIVAGAFLLLALAAENPTEINPTLQAIDDPKTPQPNTSLDTDTLTDVESRGTTPKP